MELPPHVVKLLLLHLLAGRITEKMWFAIAMCFRRLFPNTSFVVPPLPLDLSVLCRWSIKNKTQIPDVFNFINRYIPVTDMKSFKKAHELGFINAWKFNGIIASQLERYVLKRIPIWKNSRFGTLTIQVYQSSWGKYEHFPDFPFPSELAWWVNKAKISEINFTVFRVWWSKGKEEEIQKFLKCLNRETLEKKIRLFNLSQERDNEILKILPGANKKFSGLAAITVNDENIL